MSSVYKERIRELEAEYSRVADEIENRHQGVDYQARLPALRKQIDTAKKQAAKFDRIRRAVESDMKDAAKAIVEVLLDEEPESIQEITADFVENELGRFDWMNNWRVIKANGQAVERIEAYLGYMGIQANPMEIVNEIERMARETPGRWK